MFLTMNRAALAILAACLLCVPVAAKSQTIVRSFDGDTGPGAAVCDAGRTHCGWPDMDVGVNGAQVLQVSHQYAARGERCVWDTRIVEYQIGASGKD